MDLSLNVGFPWQVAISHADGTPVKDETRGITVVPSLSAGGGAGALRPVTKLPVNGLATFAFEVHSEAISLRLTVRSYFALEWHKANILVFRSTLKINVTEYLF